MGLKEYKEYVARYDYNGSVFLYWWECSKGINYIFNGFWVDETMSPAKVGDEHIFIPYHRVRSVTKQVIGVTND